MGDLLRSDRQAIVVSTPTGAAARLPAFKIRRIAGHRLHVEPDGSFSMVAIVWQPGAQTRIHDHVIWYVFGVLASVEYEDLYTLSEDGAALIEVGSNPNLTGEVSGFTPPGDIHRVRNVSDNTAISLHVYGTDLGRIGSSARRYYDLPVR
jgi:predicted metal-dependent enzyme (double-stranded beta helix superfamily)